MQVDGRIVVAGTAHPADPSNRDFALARYDADGSLDSSFGTGGKVTTDFFMSSDGAFDIEVQSDGRIVVCGQAFNEATDEHDFALARYDSDGGLDSSFGSGGKVSTDFFGSFDTALDISALPDGRIVAVGFARSVLRFDFAVARYNGDGSLDLSFGTEGKTTTDFFGEDDIAEAAVIQPDGKILAAGGATDSSTERLDIALARYTTASFDTCLQDEGNGNLLQINTSTGDYQFTSCSGFTISGTGSITTRGCTITLQDTGSDRRVLAKIDNCLNKATASVQVFSQGMTHTISDRNTANNSCSCL